MEDIEAFVDIGVEVEVDSGLNIHDFSSSNDVVWEFNVDGEATGIGKDHGMLEREENTVAQGDEDPSPAICATAAESPDEVLP